LKVAFNYGIFIEDDITVRKDSRRFKVIKGRSTINGEPPMNHIVDLCFVVTFLLVGGLLNLKLHLMY
jgi:hypothetical protein